MNFLRSSFRIVYFYRYGVGGKIRIRRGLSVLDNVICSDGHVFKLCNAVFVSGRGYRDLTSAVRSARKYEVDTREIKHSLSGLVDFDRACFFIVVNFLRSSFRIVYFYRYRVGGKISIRRGAAVLSDLICSYGYVLKERNTIFVGNNIFVYFCSCVRCSRKRETYTAQIKHTFGGFLYLYASGLLVVYDGLCQFNGRNAVAAVLCGKLYRLRERFVVFGYSGGIFGNIILETRIYRHTVSVIAAHISIFCLLGVNAVCLALAVCRRKSADKLTGSLYRVTVQHYVVLSVDIENYAFKRFVAVRFFYNR